MVIGIVSLLVGVLGTIVAIDPGSTVRFFAATAIAGFGFGGGFQGGIRTVVPLAAAHERAGPVPALRHLLHRHGRPGRRGRLPGRA